MDVITWIVLGLGAGVPASMAIPGRSRQRSRDSDPACARHGADRGQVDISAAVIRIFERLGWATKVRWPTPARLDSRRRCRAQGEPEPIR